MRLLPPVLLLAITACAEPERVGPHWTDEAGYDQLQEGDTYVAVATQGAPPQAQRDLAGEHVQHIEGTLADAPGLIYYQLDGSMFRGAMTVSVWTSHAALGAFMGSGAHGDAMQELDFEFKSDIWEIDASELPLTFAEAQQRLR